MHRLIQTYNLMASFLSPSWKISQVVEYLLGRLHTKVLIQNHLLFPHESNSNLRDLSGRHKKCNN